MGGGGKWGMGEEREKGSSTVNALHLRIHLLWISFEEGGSAKTVHGKAHTRSIPHLSGIV